jgi:hypothetical protein
VLAGYQLRSEKRLQICGQPANLQAQADYRHSQFKEPKIMATTPSQSSNFVPDIEAAVERAREANDRLVEVGRKVSSAYLNSVEQYFVGIAKFERKLGEQSNVEAITSLLDSHAKLVEDVAKTSISATRELITA